MRKKFARETSAIPPQTDKKASKFLDTLANNTNSLQYCQVNIETQSTLVPPNPGVYLFKNAAGQVLYVGKAKQLRSRVLSYFRPASPLDPAKQAMVRQTAHLETISTDTEHEALILEANLIQHHQPPYNIVLRDDKYYLFIKITREDFPRVFLTRRLKKDSARYFGPYSSAQSVRATLNLLRRLFPHRPDRDLKHDRILPHPLFQNPPLTAGGYQNNISHIISFLKGERADIVATLQKGMTEAAAKKAYEQAALFRNQLQAIARLDEQQKVYLPRAESFDLISLAREATRSAANIFSVRRGKLLNKNTFLLRHRPGTAAADILRQFILQYYRVAQDIPKNIILPELLEDAAVVARFINPNEPPTFTAAARGVKRQLQELGQRNATELLGKDHLDFLTTGRRQQALTELSAALHLPKPPRRIETYDISNIQGKLATGSMVVFVDGAPAPRHYKKFRIRLLETPNDFAMLQEVLIRRFAARNAGWPIPDLIVIDGGKGQLSATRQVLTRLKLTIPIIALAKREELIFQPKQSEPLRLSHDSSALYLMQRMRDEAHRFTITYHHTLRSKTAQLSRLDDLPGIGLKTRQKLLRHFGSLKKIRAASREEVEKIIGSKAKILQEYW